MRYVLRAKVFAPFYPLYPFVTPLMPPWGHKSVVGAWQLLNFIFIPNDWLIFEASI